MTSATARTPWTPWTATSWTAGNCGSKWRATVGLPTRTASLRLLATARRVAGPAHDPGAAAAGLGAAGVRGLGRAADPGAGLGHADAVQGPAPRGPEADPGIAGVPEVGPGRAVAEVGERAAVVVGARAAASLGTVASPDVVRLKGVGQNRGATAAQNPEVVVCQSIAVAQSPRTVVEADTAAAQSPRSEA